MTKPDPDAQTPSSAGAASSLGAMGSKMHEATSDAAASATRTARTARTARAAEDAMEGGVHRMAQKAHEAVDRLEQTLGAGSERMMDWQQEYGDMAREQVRASPLAAVGIAFGVGILFSKLFMR